MVAGTGSQRAPVSTTSMRRREQTEVGEAFQSYIPLPVTPAFPPSRLCHPRLPKQCHHLGAKPRRVISRSRHSNLVLNKTQSSSAPACILSECLTAPFQPPFQKVTLQIKTMIVREKLSASCHVTWLAMHRVCIYSRKVQKLQAWKSLLSPSCLNSTLLLMIHKTFFLFMAVTMLHHNYS